MRRRLKSGSRLSWVIVWLLAVAGVVTYVVRPDHTSWWVGVVLIAPLVGLAEWRREKEGFDGQYFGGGDGGVWGPP
jgi:apolipoprotein N-acyltransferase